MKVAVFEYFSAGRPGVFAAGLVAEGRAMRDAVAADLGRLPGIDVRVVGERRALRRAARRADAALVIGPEQDGILERLTRLVEEERRLLLGPATPFVRLAADKHATALCLAAAGIATPRARAVPFARARAVLRSWRTPFVLKPRDGCGGGGVILVRRRTALDGALAALRRATGRPDFLLQEFVDGEDASVSLIVDAGTPPALLALGLNRQRIAKRGPCFEYAGGETPWRHPLAEEAAATAMAAVAALDGARGGARGYIGVDLVLGPDGPVVIEVNPRITTSYVGLRRVLSENLAGLILKAARGRDLPARLEAAGACRFLPDGRCRDLPGGPAGAAGAAKRAEGRSSWISSAGTSAASI